jgi:hypothetical protein
MGHLFNGFNLRQDLNNNLTLTAERLFGVWEDMVISSNGSVYALSACGNNLKMFVTGNNLNGKLGIGNENNLSVFYQLTGNWSKISSGYSHTLALSSNGKLFAVGSNTSGQLGLGSSILSASTFTQVNSNIYSKIEAGGNSSFVIDQNGALYGCGTNTYGQLGLGNTDSPIYSFTRESLNGTFQLVLTDNARTVVLSSGRMLGTGLQQNTTNYATGDLTNYTTFVQECSGFTDIEDIQLHSRYSFLKRTNDSNYWYFGYIISAPSFQSPGYFFRKRTINRSIYPKRNSSSLPVYDNSTGSSAFYYVDSSSKILYKLLGGTGPGEYKYTGKYDKLFFSRTGNNQTFIALSATDNFRPTPTPSVTPTVTPTSSPLPPFISLSKIAVGYRESTASAKINIITFSDNGTGINTTQSSVINFEDNIYPPGQDSSLSNCGINFEKYSLIYPQYNANDIVRIRFNGNQSYMNMRKCINSTSLLSDFVNINNFVTSRNDIYLNILPPTNNNIYGLYILGHAKTNTTNSVGIYEQLISYDKGATWNQNNIRNNTQFVVGSDFSKRPRILTKHPNINYYSDNTYYATLLQSQNSATDYPFGSNEPVFIGYIGKGLNNSSPGNSIRRISNSQDNPDLQNYFTHNFTYSKSDIPYCIFLNALQQILIYTPNFSNNIQNSSNPWNQILKYTDSNCPQSGQAPPLIASTMSAIYNNLNCINIIFDRQNPNFLYYSYPLYTSIENSYKKGFFGGIAVGTYNIGTGENATKNAFRARTHYNADINSPNINTGQEYILGHELITDNNNDLWLFIFCNVISTSLNKSATLSLLKLNKSSGVWGLIKTINLGNNVINDLLSITYK